ncbi:MAG: zinc ribbon domain-containing protein [Anaerolineae bacterium]
MMGMMFLWPIFLLFFLALPIALVVGAYWLYRKAERAGGLIPARVETAPTAYTRACPSCGRFLQEGWVKCPYCGSEILQAGE